MYRLFKYGVTSLHNVPVQSDLSSRTICTLCSRTYTSRFRGFDGGESLYSTSAVPINSVQKSKRKKVIKRKMYTHLLEVKSDQVKETTPRVKKLGAHELSQFTNSISHSSKLPLVPVSVPIETQEASELLEEVEELVGETPPNEETTLEILPIVKNQSLIEEIAETHLPETKKIKRNRISKENREKMAKVKYGELEKVGKQRTLNSSLASYLELCVNCGHLNRALGTLLYFTKHKNKGEITDVKVFNTVMDGFARGGNVDKINEVWKLMETVGLKPNLQSYACKLEAIARSSRDVKADLVGVIIQQMESEKLDLNSMIVDGTWRSNAREYVIRVIQSVLPTFTPKPKRLELEYNNDLVNQLNSATTATLNSPASGVITRSQAIKALKEQLEFEQACTVVVPSVETNVEISETVLHYRGKLQELEADWTKAILTGLHRDLQSLNTMNRNMFRHFKTLNIYPYLTVLDRSVYKDIMLDEIRKLAEGSESFSPTLNQLYRNIGAQVKLRYDVKIKQQDGVIDKIEDVYKDYLDWYLNPSKYERGPINSRQSWMLSVANQPEGPSVDIQTGPWPTPVLQAIGRFLYNIILRDVKVDVNALKTNAPKHLLPAFYSVFRYQGHTTKEEVKPHPVLCRVLREAALPSLSLGVDQVPMLCPPLPWSSLSSGGYLLARTPLVRLPAHAFQQLDRLAASPPSQLYPELDSLNQLSSIPWTVNEPILDVVIHVFNSGGNSKLDIPEPPTSLPSTIPLTPEMDRVERALVHRQRMLLRRQRAEMYSLWCDALYRLSLANYYRGKVFWLPHNMDFRGRVYPCPPHLNHLGSDMARSLLVFAKGQPLGPNGLDWLKIHLVNLTGLKKRDSIADRLAFANTMLPEILDSANNPLNGKGWWKDSDEPWQTLACCLEIKNALDSGDPEKFVSRFPVHQDGSCNGLQHYAALGRDSAGAASVNLTPAPRPQDVYSAVAALVEQERATDAANGLQIAQVLEGFVKRKVIKQTVMTTVYGVTRFGARLQIAKQLRDIEDFPKEHVWPASTYLTSKTFTSLRQMFTSTREIQDWFTESARMIAQVCGQNVEYVTPLGLPVVQPYSKYNRVDSKNTHRGSFHEHYSMDTFERPNVMKQKNAFPPNFIHSLDSTHMMLTSLYCQQAGITFVSVHDCFWTHPASVPTMNKICREQFVALHSQPILDELSVFLQQHYSYSTQQMEGDSEFVAATKVRLNNLLRQLPSRGDFDLTQVLKSVYFFS